MTKENKIMINYILESHAIMRMKKKNNNKTKKKTKEQIHKLQPNCNQTIKASLDSAMLIHSFLLLIYLSF